MNSAKVLLVDDEEDFRVALAERMKARGMQVDVAANGQEALELAKQHPYDAILLDLLMPEMDGFETLKQLLQIDSSLQIIMLTGHGSLQEGIKAVKMGAVDFLEKPADIKVLVEKIKEAQETSLHLFEQNLDKKISDITKKKSW